MPIEKRQPGEAAAAAKAGTIIGTSEKAKREQAQAEQARQQQAAIKAREQAEQRAMDWELEKMRMNSQLAYQKETRAEIRAMEADDVAHQRAVERIEVSKDLDHQYKEQERLRKISVIDNSDAAIDKLVASGEHTEDELAIRTKRSQNDAARQVIETGVTPRQEKTSALSLLGGGQQEGPQGGTTANPLGFEMETPSEQGLTSEELQTEVEQKFKVISPDGDEETIDTSEWAEYKSRGYILADISNLRYRKKMIEFDKSLLGVGERY